ncbi:MAG TPA: hypothetical protein VF457_13420 [Burkholderiaceae bacterium]
MTALHILVNLLAYAVFGLGGLLAWPSRYNVIAWLSVPFFVIAYVIPLWVIDYRAAASLATIDRLTWINAVGALAMVVGIVAGGRLRRPVRNPLSRWLRPSAAARADATVSTQRTWRFMLIACILMTLCFAWMRMVPMFADEPFLAKFFRGPYKARYDQVSIPYRFAQAVLGAALPLAMVYALSLRDRKQVLPVLWAVVLFAVSLNRGTVAAGAVLIYAAWASRRLPRVLAFLAVAVVVYGIGSSVYAILGIISPKDFNLWEQIALGAPDVTDHLDFLGAFRDHDLTYGLTFVGGLVPGNFRFNPSVFTLAIVNGSSDVSDVASGGLRMPPSVAGFMAFSWLGAVLVPFVSGLLTGHFVHRLRRLPRENLAQHVAGLLWYQVCASFLINFYAMSYQGLIAMLLFFYLVPDIGALARLPASPPLRRRRWRLGRRRNVLATP